MGPVEGISQWFAMFRCDNCGYGTVGQMAYPKNSLPGTYQGRTFTTANIDSAIVTWIKEKMDAPDAPITWLPQHVLGRSFDDVPEHISDAASEAYSCHSIGAYRAAILMARSVVEAVAKDQGVTQGNLVGKIDTLAAKQLIRPLIQQSAHEIRHLGNDMAHGDFVEPTSSEDSDDMLDFMSVILAEVYQLPAQVNARKSTREARAQVARERREAEQS